MRSLAKGATWDNDFDIGLFLIRALVLTLLGVLARLLYNVYFSPLSRFPGPRAYGATSIPIAYAQLTGTCHKVVKALHDRYGPVVRIAPNELSFISPNAWHDIYGRRRGKPPLPRDPTFFNEDLLHPDTITLADDEKHARIRHALAPAFSPRALAGQESMLQDKADMLLHRLSTLSQTDDTVDLQLWYTYTTFDILGDLGFGEPFGCLETSSYHEWIQLVIDRFDMATILQVLHRFSPLHKLFAFFVPKSMIAQQERQANLSLEKVRRRMSKDLDRPDFLYHLMKAVDGLTMTTGEVEKQASILILAGSETTSLAIAFATYFLLQNPDCLQRLAAEVETAFQKQEDITIRSVNALKYLHAVVQEALRLAPPITNGFPRITPPEGSIIDGHRVPGNTSVNINQWSAFQSASHFDQPDQFVPERWLGAPQFQDDAKSAFQPFSVGPRNCIGKTMAYNSIKLILVKIIWTFDMSLSPESRGWFDNQQAFVSWHQPPLLVSLKTKRR